MITKALAGTYLTEYQCQACQHYTLGPIMSFVAEPVTHTRHDIGCKRCNTMDGMTLTKVLDLDTNLVYWLLGCFFTK